MSEPHLDANVGDLVFNEAGLIPAIIQDDDDDVVLMMAWMTPETVEMTLQEGRTVFWSRSRSEIWRKGETSGERQWVRSVNYDCDGDVLLIRVKQDGTGACHTGERTCFHRVLAASQTPSEES